MTDEGRPGWRYRAAILVPLMAVDILALACASSTDPDPVTEADSLPELAEPCDVAGHAGDPYAAGVNCRTIDVDGYVREFLAYVPPGHTFTAEQLLPVVLMFHGGSQNGERFLHLSRWREKADEVGLIAVFPTALQHFVLDEDRWATRWHDVYLSGEVDLTRRPAGYPTGAPWPADDVAFVRAMLDDLENVAYADPERMYATGFSNGASFTATLAAHVTDRLAAFAYVGGRFCDSLSPDWTRAPPRPTTMVFGASDAKLLGDVLGDEAPASIPLALDADSLMGYAALAECLEVPVSDFDLAWEPFDVLEEAGQTQIEWSTSLGPSHENTFRLIVLGGLGHMYPNGTNNPLGWDAADRFWDFFQEHKLEL